MSYKSNYEPYTSQSLDLNSLRPSEELLYPLDGLYPHVVALQLQSHDGNPWAWSAARHFSGYQDVSYWTEVVSSPRSLPEHYSKHRLRRYSGKFATFHVSFNGVCLVSSLASNVTYLGFQTNAGIKKQQK
ncbi:uncharacterized protein BJX67DRAFT_382440 [Aspergillus lucknowensis]|uniref:Uncharacterized protein n=1 Tax=Aspergillus lucknowensis TaxID=176173 RepID=A0ABR4LQT4_9EURO